MRAREILAGELRFKVGEDVFVVDGFGGSRGGLAGFGIGGANAGEQLVEVVVGRRGLGLLGRHDAVDGKRKCCGMQKGELLKTLGWLVGG